MSIINTKLSVGDFVYQKEGRNWNKELMKYTSFEVETYQVRSIAISCNSKNEWRISYRVQRFVDGKTIDYGFNFKEEELGQQIFLTQEEAENYNIYKD